MLPANARRRSTSATGFLESLIDPIDWLSETTFSILIFLTFTLAFWLIGLSGVPKQYILPAEVNELLIGALGAVVAWGLIDGIMYALFSVFEQGDRRRLLDDVQAARLNEEANVHRNQPLENRFSAHVSGGCRGGDRPAPGWIALMFRLSCSWRSVCSNI
jgi:hypothetical protein